MAKKKSVEAQVKEHLTKIKQIDGGWVVMLDILHRRGLIKMLKEARLAQGLTQAQVAERMSVTQGRVAEIENDPWPDPYLSTLARYAHALDMEFHVSATPIPDLPEPDAEPEDTGEKPAQVPQEPSDSTLSAGNYPEDPEACGFDGCPYTAVSCQKHRECYDRRCRRAHDGAGFHL